MFCIFAPGVLFERGEPVCLAFSNEAGPSMNRRMRLWATLPFAVLACLLPGSSSSLGFVIPASFSRLHRDARGVSFHRCISCKALGISSPPLLSWWPGQEVSTPMSLGRSIPLSSSPSVKFGRRVVSAVARREGEEIDHMSNLKNRDRHLVVVCHNTTDAVAAGKFKPNNLLEGRVDVMCRCITAALYVSNGVRRRTRIWIALQPQDVVVGVWGGGISGLNPDEKTVALFLQRALEVDTFKLEREAERIEQEQPKEGCAESEVPTFLKVKGSRQGFSKSDRNLAKKQRERRMMAVSHWEVGEDGDPLTPPGFTVERNLPLDALLSRLLVDGETGEKSDIMWLHEEGVHIGRELAAGGLGKGTGPTVVVVGDQVGFNELEEDLLSGIDGVKKVSLGSTSLLASQCLLLTHHYLDGDGKE